VLRELRVHAFDARRSTGQVKALWARLASGTGQVVAGIVTRPGVFAGGRELADALHEAGTRLREGREKRELVGIVHSISDRDDEFLLGDRHVPLRGTDHVIDRRDGLTFRVSAGSFYQVHADAHELLYRPALRMCGDIKGKTVIDGYGGIGAFGVRFAKAGAAAVTIVEDNAAACRDAEHNIAANELKNACVLRAPFADAKLPERPDLLVVDPPRIGLQSGGVTRLLAARPTRVLLVACELDSMARDLDQLIAKGFRVTAMRLCDLFPHTERVELLAMLERA